MFDCCLDKAEIFFSIDLRAGFAADAKKTSKPSLLLTAAVPAGPDNIKNGFDVKAVSSSLDFINVMAYDYHGTWERVTGYNAPLNGALSVDSTTKLWVQLGRSLILSEKTNSNFLEHFEMIFTPAFSLITHISGAPKEKLVIGMATYGRSFTLANPGQNGPNSPANGAGRAGPFTGEAGIMAYYEVCQFLPGAKTVWDDSSKVPYAFKGDQWVGYDDERSIRGKMAWIKQNGYGGAMVWTLDMDDFTGTICSAKKKYPLISTMR